MAIENYKEIAVLGDSITNGYFDEEGLGWIPRLSLLLNADKPNGYFFRNHAVSGDCIYDVKYRLFGAIERSPDALFIAVGVNDTMTYGDQHKPMAINKEMRRDLWLEVLKFATKNVPQVFVFGLLPANEANIPARVNDLGSPQIYSNQSIAEYNKEIEGYCAQFGVAFIQFFDRFMAAGHADLLADDVHPNAKGHALLAKFAYEAIKERL